MTIKAVVFDAYGTLYDIQSVASVTEQAFPGYGDIITQIWRIKQLEYTWLRSLMRRYQDFAVVTADSLAYTLRVLGLTHDEAMFARCWTNICISISIPMRSPRWRNEGQEARHPLQWQPGHAECAGDERRARPLARCGDQRRRQQGVQALPGGLCADRSPTRRSAGRGAVRLVQSLGRLRREHSDSMSPGSNESRRR